MEALGAAYRRLSCAAARQLLHLPAGGPEAPPPGGDPPLPGGPEPSLAAILKACADRGSGCATRALSSLQMAEPSAAAVLVFRL